MGGGLWLFGGAITTNILKTGVMIVLARLIAPAQFGVFAEATTLMALITVAVELGLGSALVQRKEIDDRHESSALILTVFSGLFACVLLALIADPWSRYRNLAEIGGAMRLLGVSLLFRAPSTIPAMLMMRQMRMGEVAILQLGAFVFGQAGVSIVLGVLGYGSWALVWGTVAGAFLELVLFSARRPVPIRRGFSMKAARELMNFGGGFTVAKIANAVALQGDNLIVGMTLGSGALGLYSRAYSLLAIPSALVDSLDRAFFPALSRVQDDKAALAATFRLALLSIAVIALPLSALVTLLAPEVVEILLGAKWMGVVTPLQILAPVMFFRIAYKVGSTTIRAGGHVGILALSQVIYAVNVLAGAYWGASYGLSGSAIGVGLAIGIQYILMIPIGARQLGVSMMDALVPCRGAVIMFATTSVAVLGVARLGRTYGLPSVATLTLGLLAFAATAILLYRIGSTRLLGVEYREFTSGLLAKIRGRMRPGRQQAPSVQ